MTLQPLPEISILSYASMQLPASLCYVIPAIIPPAPSKLSIYSSISWVDFCFCQGFCLNLSSADTATCRGFPVFMDFFGDVLDQWGLGPTLNVVMNSTSSAL